MKWTDPVDIDLSLVSAIPSMAIEAHVKTLAGGVSAWNRWRARHRKIEPDLSFAHLPVEDLNNADLHDVDLRGVVAPHLNLRGANLSRASLIDTILSGSDLDGADLSQAFMHKTDLSDCTLRKADLSSVYGAWVRLGAANLEGANMKGATLEWADLSGASLRGADLSGANLTCARLINTDLSEAVLSGSTVYGVSAWAVKLERAQQRDLVITKRDEPAITVDDLELAHFIYQMLTYDKVRRVLDTITSKAVLLLGRFTPKRKRVLDRIRDRLREEGYSPIVFDFNVPADRDITETVTTLARMCRFIVADLTEPASIPKELEAIAPRVAVPVQPLIQGTERPYSMFKDYWKYPWILELKRYGSQAGLMANFRATVMEAAEAKAAELARTKARKQ